MDATAEFQRGLHLQLAGDQAGAEVAYRQVLGVALHASALSNLTSILQAAGRIEEAGAIIQHALALAPEDSRLRAMWANQLYVTRDLRGSQQAYREALQSDPDEPKLRCGYATSLLADGQLEEAWPFYEAREQRLRAEEWAGSSFAAWRGEDLAGRRLLVWHEQGFGDQILAARFLPLIRGGTVTYAGPPALERLLSGLGVRYQPVRRTMAVTGQDCWTLPLSIPGLLGVGAHNLPGRPYLSGNARPSGGRVGLAWRGNPNQFNDRNRSLPVEQAQRLLSLPGVISLAPEDTGARDFQDTADLIAGLELVVSVDTSVAHLAGAMGAPLWVLLATQGSAWPWPRHKPNLWYPQARAFHQAKPGDWSPVVDEVEAALLA